MFNNSATQKWKDMIKFYSLEGYHIRANQELYNEMDLKDQIGRLAYTGLNQKNI